MPGLFANPFASRSNELLPTVEPRRANDQVLERRLSTTSMDGQLDWHETFMFGATEEPRRVRRASSFGDISEFVAQNAASAAAYQQAGNEQMQAPPINYSRFRSDSIMEARQQGWSHTRQRQGSVAQGRRTSVSTRRPSIADRRGSIQAAHRSDSESRGRQPSVAWARQSSIIDSQLSKMTWSQAERLMSLDDRFYNDVMDSNNTQKSVLLADKLQRLGESKATKDSVIEIEGPKDEEATYPKTEDPVDPAKVLSKWNLRKQKLLIILVVLALNGACLAGCLIGGGPSGTFVFVFILMMKSKDILSVLLVMAYLPLNAVWRLFRPLPPVTGKWILTLIPAYSESEETLIKAVRSLRQNLSDKSSKVNSAGHEQVMVIILDGKPRDVKAHMRVIKSFRRPYTTFRWKRGQLLIDAGFIDDVPVILMEKVKNAGKKDSLILCFDLFNALRDNAPLYTKLLRMELEQKVLPLLTKGKSIPFTGFDMMFCTDADSVIYPGALSSLANALIRDPNAIASCGSVLVDTSASSKWSFWNLYQQFQYSFGQFVRRRAESIWGKVTCLPGCITMIRVREEMKGAIEKYAEPITKSPVIHHQVQYLGTDRRLTYSMLSQSKKLHTIFVPGAVSLTEAPQSLAHYLSQRRRWGANSYFNDWFYLFGENMLIVTRLVAMIEITRLSMVYYRIANTIIFFVGLGTRAFTIKQLIPLLVISQFPTAWYFVNVACIKELRRRTPQIILGFFINHLVTSFMSMTIFFNVLRHLGSQVWGMTGGSTAAVAPVASTTTEKSTTVQGIIAPDAIALKHLDPATVEKASASRVVSIDQSSTLATLAEVEELEDPVGPGAPPLSNEQHDIPPKPTIPLGMNTSFGFGSSTNQDNPFGDHAEVEDSFDSSGFGGFGFSDPSTGHSGRRRSSAAGPLDRRRRSSTVHASALPDESKTIYLQHGIPTTAPTTSRSRLASAASGGSKGKGSIVDITIVEEETEEAPQPPIQPLLTPLLTSRRPSISTALESHMHSPVSPSVRRTSVSPASPTFARSTETPRNTQDLRSTKDNVPTSPSQPPVGRRTSLSLTTPTQLPVWAPTIRLASIRGSI